MSASSARIVPSTCNTVVLPAGAVDAWPAEFDLVEGSAMLEDGELTLVFEMDVFVVGAPNFETYSFRFVGTPP